MIIIGVMLGFVPACLTTYIQLRSQREQLFMERRMTVLKEYSTSFNKLASEILPRARKLKSLVAEIKDMPLIHGDELGKKLKLLNTEIELYDQQFDIWRADVNTQVALVNAVFDIQFNMFEFQESKPESSTEAASNDIKANIIETESQIVHLNKTLNKLLETGQNNARLLVSHIQP